MKKKYNIEFWNFICHFGDLKLLDKFVDIVYPAFFNGYEREYGETRFLFKYVKLLSCEIEDEVFYFIYGVFIKDTLLKREQVLKGEELVEDPKELPTSPSSIFILSLLDHRLFFIKEHKDSPDMGNFKSTINHFMKRVILEKVNNEYNSYNEMRAENGGNQGRFKRKTKKDFIANYPEPELEIVQSSSDAEIEQFVRELKSIEKLTLDIINPNDEFDCNKFFEATRNTNKDMGVNSSKHVFTKTKSSVKNNTLPHDEVIKLSKEAVDDSNINFAISGKDLKGVTIDGTNETFKLSVPIDEVDDNPKFLSKKVYQTYMELVSSGVIRGALMKDIDAIKKKISQILDFLDWR